MLSRRSAGPASRHLGAELAGGPTPHRFSSADDPRSDETSLRTHAVQNFAALPLDTLLKYKKFYRLVGWGWPPLMGHEDSGEWVSCLPIALCYHGLETSTVFGTSGYSRHDRCPPHCIFAQNCSDSEEKGKLVVAVSKHFSSLVSREGDGGAERRGEDTMPSLP